MSDLRCVCLNVSLRELLERARSAGWRTVGEIAAATGCGAHCQSCRPYIARMLQTGRPPTTRDIMSAAELAKYRE